MSLFLDINNLNIFDLFFYQAKHELLYRDENIIMFY